MANTPERVPRLTAREHWGQYLAGIVTEAAFILGLAGVGLLLAAVAMAVFK